MASIKQYVLSDAVFTPQLQATLRVLLPDWLISSNPVEYYWKIFTTNNFTLDIFTIFIICFIIDRFLLLALYICLTFLCKHLKYDLWSSNDDSGISCTVICFVWVAVLYTAYRSSRTLETKRQREVLPPTDRFLSLQLSAASRQHVPWSLIMKVSTGLISFRICCSQLKERMTTITSANKCPSLRGVWTCLYPLSKQRLWASKKSWYPVGLSGL